MGKGTFYKPGVSDFHPRTHVIEGESQLLQVILCQVPYTKNMPTKISPQKYNIVYRLLFPPSLSTWPSMSLCYADLFLVCDPLGSRHSHPT